MNGGRSALDLWVGIFVAIGIGAILFLALKVGNLVTFGSTEGYRLEARFDNIGGLKARAPIKASGVVVGRVERIRFDPKTYQAVVTLKIEHAYPFTTDTIASILTSGLLGEVYVGLEAGGDTTMLPDGGKIAKTQSAMILEKLIGQFLFDKAASGGNDKAAPGGGSDKAAPSDGNDKAAPSGGNDKAASSGGSAKAATNGESAKAATSGGK